MDEDDLATDVGVKTAGENVKIADLLGGDSNVGIFGGSITCIQCKTFPGHGKGMLVWLFPPRMFFDGWRWPT